MSAELKQGSGHAARLHAAAQGAGAPVETNPAPVGEELVYDDNPRRPRSTSTYTGSVAAERFHKTLIPGTRIYYGGGAGLVGNGFGTIVAVEHGKYQTNIRIKMDEGELDDDGKPTGQDRIINVAPFSFSAEYLGHGGTPFVTEAAYNAYMEKTYGIKPPVEPYKMEMNPKKGPPGRWSHEATVAFYERHHGSLTEMVNTIEGWYSVPASPHAIAAQIKDYVEKSTKWRGKPADYDKPKKNPAAVENPRDRNFKYGDFLKRISGAKPEKSSLSDGEKKAAMKIYAEFQKRQPDTIRVTHMKTPSALIRLGRADSIMYESDKWGKKPTLYKHTFESPDCEVYWDLKNNALVIRGSELEITGRGIEG